jgi:hypothetical protein
MLNIVQRFSPIPAFGTLAIPIIFSLAFGCNSHPATIAASPPHQPDTSGPTAAAVGARETVSSPSPLDGTPTVAIVAAPKQPSPVVIGQESTPMAIGDSGFPSGPQESLAIVAPSETSRKVQVVVGRIVDTLLRLDGTTWMGLGAIAAMLILYAMEDRSPFFTLAFAAACWTASTYGVLKGSWLIGLAGGIWGCLALRRWWRRIQARGDSEDRVVIWPVRVLGVLAVMSGVVLLIVDSPLSAQLPIPITRAVAEAIPLLLVGIAYLAWLAIDRPPTIDLVKQIFIAAAFILWGINLLMPRGPRAQFVGAVVIAIYVFDLAWLMEGNLRKRFGIRALATGNQCRSTDCQSAGVCGRDDIPENSRKNGNGRRADPSPVSNKE